MSFAGFTLAQLWPILAVGSAAITAMYLLRMRRRQVVVPFAALWEQVTRAPFLTINEKREATGYSPIDGGDRIA